MHLTAFLEFALQTLQGAGDSIPAAWRAVSQSASALALNAVWQGVAVALGLAFCLRLAPRTPARHRFTLWAAGFTVLVTLQFLPMLQHLFPVSYAAGSAELAGAAAPAPHAWLQLNPAWSLVIAILWLTASLYRASDLAVHSLHLRKLWRTAVPVALDAASLPRSVERLSAEQVRVCTTRDLERPSVIGFFAPRILIPEWLFARLTPGELDQIVLHETEHLRRRDDWSNLLQKLCLVLFPLNPGLAWIERRLCREREMACDDGVVHITRAPRAYAACLASIAERGLQRRAGALSLGAWQRRPELVRRVHSILARKHALSPLAARAVLGALGCVLLAGGSALARCPRLIAFVPVRSAAVHSAPVAREANLTGSGARGVVSLPGVKTPAAKAPAVEQAALSQPAIRPRRPARLQTATHSRSAAPQLASVRAGDETLRAQSAAGAGGLATSESGYMVMTTWEALEPSREAATQSAAKDTAGIPTTRVAGARNAFALRPTPKQFTVTRMYLQIYSVSGVRQSTWLVVQL
jgi:beta-lactamase regulating signal transducer with metallopeptidase domain